MVRGTEITLVEEWLPSRFVILTGIMMKKDDATALFLAAYMSALVPAPTARTGPPSVPAKNLQTSRLASELLKPAPRMKSMYDSADTLYTTDRPYVSEMGAAIIGPTARPSTKRDRARIDTVRDTSNRSAISGVAGVMRDEPHVTEKPRQAVAAVW